MNTRNETIRDMQEHLLKVGLFVDELIADGKIHRCGVTGKENGQDGSYVARISYGPPYLWWKNWRTGKNGRWTSKDFTGLTKGERKEWEDHVRSAKAAEMQDIIERRKEAAEKATAIWQSLTSANKENAYLKRKRVLPFGDVKQAQDGKLVLPVRKANGNLVSLQFIANDGGKRFLPGGEVQGCFFSLPAENDDNSGPLLIAEGYATAASLRMATGYAVLVAFNAGNLPQVARIVRELYPGREIIVCADNDVRKDGTVNVGVQKATEAAKTIDAKLAICPDIDGNKADFNDLHTSMGDGRARVKECVEKARTDENLILKLDNEQRISCLPAGYFIRESGPKAGLYALQGEGEDVKEFRLGPPINVLGRTHDEQSKNWGILLEWKDPKGVPHRKSLPEESLQVQGTDWAGSLAGEGYSIEPSMQKRFRSFLASVNAERFITNTSKVGWYQNCFVLPDASIGAEDDLVVLQSLDSIGDMYQTGGTLEGWQEMARLCAGNTRFTFALCAAFAGPLLKLAGLEGGGFSFEGPSSCGKTTCLQIAASVWGSPSHVRTWRTTSNGLEAIASLHNDGLLVLDEVGQVKAKDLSETAYMLANGSGKTRAGRSGGVRQISSWHLLFLSSGELGLAAKLSEDGLKSRAGQEVRFAGIPVDTSDVIALNGFFSSGALVQSIKEATAQHYGHASRAFLEWLVKDLDTMKKTLPKVVEEIAIGLCPMDASEQVQRVAKRFALISIAGTLAKEAGVISENIDEGEAVKNCFTAWLDERGNLGSAEEVAILSTVRLFIEQHGASRFQDMGSSMAICHNRAGFLHRRTDGKIEYYILSEVFKAEVVKGYSVKRAIKVLNDAGWIKTGGERDRNTTRILTQELGRVSCYVISLPEDA